MADWFLGINRGQSGNPGNVAAGSSTNSTDIEIRIDTGKGTTKEDALLAVETILQFILGNYIPSGTPGANMPPL